MDKGQIWVSAILYILVVTVVLVIVLNAGVPVLRDLQDKSVFTKQKNAFLSLNQQINDISEEGIGSQRVVPIEIEKGNLELKDGALKWNLRTDANILESGQQIELGNLYISSNADVSATSYANNYTLENTYMRIAFHKCEDQDTCTFNHSCLMMDNQPVFKDPESDSEIAAANQFQFDFGAGSSWNYSGYSTLEDSGSSLGAARVLYYINNTNSSYYTVVEFTLESNRDFLQVKIR
jgi:type II secretory pathway pseudopilin PulG